MKYKPQSALAALLVAMLLPSIATAQLQWFGYAGGGDSQMLDRTAPYINFGYFITDGNPTNTAATAAVNRIVGRDMKVLVELGQLLWAPGANATYRSLYPDFRNRWNTWKSYNPTIFSSEKILAFLVRDEPFQNRVNIDQYEMAAQMVKQDFPWAKIILIEAAAAVYDPSPSSYFNLNRLRINTVDWIGVDRYAIDPTTDTIFRTAVTKFKQSYPGRKFVYVGDGYWDDMHRQFLGNNIVIMRDIMTKWYDVARNDPDAVLLGMFIWGSGPGSIGSDGFPQSVLDEHFRVGKAITGRVRTQSFQPVGVFEGFDENQYAVGWACDPDAKWGETVRVDFYEAGSGLIAATWANLSSSESFPQCQTGIGHRFKFFLPYGAFGKKITAYASDLDSGIVQLPSTCLDAPGCTWYANDYQPTGQFRISSTGLTEGWTCDPDAPLASIKFDVRALNPVTANMDLVGIFTANLPSDEEINGQCGGGTAHRFSVQLPSWTKGRQITLNGKDTMQGSNFLLAYPDSGCPAIGVCIW
jgi:hypothetical protein